MSISAISSTISRLLNEISDLNRKKSLEIRKIDNLNAKIRSIQNSINKSTSFQQLNSKLSDVARKEKEISNSQLKLAEYSTKLAQKEQKLLKEKQALTKAENLEHQKYQKDQLNFQRRLKQEMTNINSGNNPTIPLYLDSPTSDDEKFDFFISHASEDKEDFVKPLVELLEARGIRVWFDECTLRVGDSLTSKIDQGLINSKYGVVVLSKAFMSKSWTKYELNSLVTREIHDGKKVILPIWHGISEAEIMTYSLNFSDKFALISTKQSKEEIAENLIEVLLP